MEADNCQVTTVQPSFHHRRSTNGVSRRLPSSANDAVRCDCMFADDGNALMILSLSSTDGGMTLEL